jgi:hypothetical protein
MKLLEALRQHAVERGVSRGFVVTSGGNREMMELYRAFGGVQGSDDDVVVLFRF